ncbi:hypothetical protein ACJMK2_030549 [Sinanodonta woodiana]|uniref:Uncharacterized protein n=1 Tax=Sinanodonta woodiana TaxID=1069815 RepID=A0ABD3WW22_SINWO
MKSTLATVFLFVSTVMIQYSISTTEQDIYLRQAGNMDNTWTAGNTKCRPSTRCDFHGGTSYSWCYTDYSNNWDYCCTGPCNSNGKPYLWCQSGDTFQYCGDGGSRDISGRKCLNTHRCGVHMDTSTARLNVPDRYWCLVDINGNWGFCCAPFSPCGKHGKTYNWCRVDVVSLGLDEKSCTIN